jgi:hypothetical protein
MVNWGDRRPSGGYRRLRLSGRRTPVRIGEIACLLPSSSSEQQAGIDDHDEHRHHLPVPPSCGHLAVAV